MGFVWPHNFLKAIHCPFSCEQDILQQKPLLQAGQKEATPAHGYFCMDSNAGCFVEFYASCSQGCPVFGQFLEHCTVAKKKNPTAQLLLHCCGHFNYRRVKSFLLPDCT
ncbi:hypothetical protein TNCV_4990471 [Trichonephila clavipes]|nr:hypothetical protein TNCV_4990471 [Trichonephila clavipes]